MQNIVEFKISPVDAARFLDYHSRDEARYRARARSSVANL